jgi:hypothetical protein
MCEAHWSAPAAMRPRRQDRPGGIVVAVGLGHTGQEL